MSGAIESLVTFWASNDDTTRIKIIIQSLTFTQKLWCKENILAVIFRSNVLCVAHRNGRLNHHDGIRIYLLHHFDDFFHMTCIKVILDRIIVCWCGDDYKVGIFISRLCIHRSCKIQFLFSQILLNIIILNG